MPTEKEDSGELDWIIPIILGAISAIALLRWLSQGGFVAILIALLFGIGMFSTLKLGIISFRNWRKKH